MLKTASGGSTTGQLSYQGTWNANTNSPTLASGTGTKNNYYVVSVAGTTTLDGISSWSVGDWAIFNGTVWEKVLGGTTESFANVSITTATGYLYANNTANVTASLTIPNSGLANSNVIIGNVTIALGSSTANLANLTLANVTIQSGTFPSGNLSANSATIGNTVVALGSTVTTLGNVTLANPTLTNATVSSVGVTFPNNFLSNSSATLGNATIILGGTTSNVGNLTLANVIIQSGTIPSANLSSNSSVIGNTTVALGSTVTSLGNVTLINTTISSGTANLTTANVTFSGASSSIGSLSVGGAANITADTGLIASFVGSATSYSYVAVQNKQTSNTAYGAYSLYNESGTVYADLGINSTTYSYSAAGFPNNNFSLPNATFLQAGGGDLSIGTNQANAVHFIANGAVSTADAMTINSNNSVTIVSMSQSTSSTATFATSSLPLVPAGYLIINNNGTNVKVPYYAV